MVLDAIFDFIKEKVIIAGVTWVIGLLNPASAFFKACKAIYDIVMFFINRGSQILALVNAVIDSIGGDREGVDRRGARRWWRTRWPRRSRWRSASWPACSAWATSAGRSEDDREGAGAGQQGDRLGDQRGGEGGEGGRKAGQGPGRKKGTRRSEGEAPHPRQAVRRQRSAGPFEMAGQATRSRPRTLTAARRSKGRS